MNKEELKDKIKELEQQLAEAKRELEKKEQDKIWKPGEDGTYFYLTSTLEVDDTCNAGWGCDRDRFEVGNYFKTYKEAEKQANYLKYTNLFRKYVEERSEPLDWEESAQAKYYCFYDFDDEEVYIAFNTTSKRQGVIHASSKEVLLDAINFVGKDNVKKYIFGVEND